MDRSASALHDDELLATRPMEAVSSEVQSLIRILSVAKQATVVGSFRYQTFEYPSDVDLMEFIPRGMSLKRFAAAFRATVTRVHRDPRFTVTDIKAGVDDRYAVTGIGRIRNGRLVGFDLARIVQHAARLRAQGLLTAAEAEAMRRAAERVQVSDPFSRANLVKEIRRHFILRWSPTEVIRNRKTLRGGKSVTLRQAISSRQTRVKIDAVAFVEGHRFVEFSNIPVLRGVTVTSHNYRRAILNEIAGWIHNNKKWLKVAKRYWLLAAQDRDPVALRLLGKLFRGPAGKLGQIAADLESLCLVPSGGRQRRRIAIGSIKQRLASTPPTLMSPAVLVALMRSLAREEKRGGGSGTASARALERIAQRTMAAVDRHVKSYMLRNGVMHRLSKFLKRERRLMESVPEMRVLLGVG